MIIGAHAVVFTRDAEANRADLRPTSRGSSRPPVRRELERKGVELARPVSDEGFGLLTAIVLPGGGELPLYEPRHPIPRR
jgi:hypothetical protein